MKRMRVLAAALLAALVAVLPGCGRTSATPTVRVGVAVYDQTDTFISTITQHLEQMFQEEEQRLGVKINLSVADGRSSQSVQNEQVDRFLDLGCDVICVNIVDRTAAAVIVDKARAAEVPVIFFNREPVEEDLLRWEGAYYVGSPGAEAGRLQGMLVVDAWRADAAALDRSGDGVLQYVMLEGEPGHQDALLRTEHSIQTLVTGGVQVEKLESAAANWQDGVLQYVMLEGEPGHQDALLRTEHSIQTLVTGGVQVEKLESAAANWQRSQAAERMRQWLETVEEPIEAVFANNDDMALGAIDACLEAGMSVEELPFIVGVDATAQALEAVRAGTLQGTVRNDARGQAESIMALSRALMGFEDVSEAVELTDGKYVWLSYTAVTAADVLSQAVPAGR